MKKTLLPSKTRITHNKALMLFAAVFLILKMIRSFSGSTSEGGAWNVIQALFSIVGIVLLIKRVWLVKSSPALVLMTIYSVIVFVISCIGITYTVNGIFNLIVAPYPIAIFVLFYGSEIKKDDNEDNLYIIVVTFYVIAALFILNMLIKGKYSTSTGAVADVYYVLGLLPLALLNAKRFRLVPIAVCCLAVIVSGKRAGLLCFITMITLYLLIEAFRNNKAKTFVKNIILFAVIIIIGIIVFKYLNENFNAKLLDRLMDISEDGGSGRQVRWDRVLVKEWNSSVVHIFFGHGRYATLKLLGGHAHNDFLEIMYDYGVIALAAYVFFYIALIIEAIGMFRRKYKYATLFLLGIVFSIYLAMFSFYFVTPTYVTSGMITLGTISMNYRKDYKDVLPQRKRKNKKYEN